MSRPARVAIHGFGRTGRQAFKAIWEQHTDTLLVAAIGLREPDDASAAAHLLQYDSNYGRFSQPVSVADGALRVGDSVIPIVSAPTLAELPWNDLGIDIAIESSGAFIEGRSAAGHLEAGARKVLVTAPCEGADVTLVYGVNETEYDPASHHLVSIGSDTTNALAAVVAALRASFQVKNALVTAVRAYTTAQKLLDTADHDLRRARSAPLSIVPTSTRAASAIGQVFPDMAGRLSGYAVRVPVPTVSILELTAQLDGEASAGEINDAFRRAVEGPLGRVLAVSSEPLVSTDYCGSTFSAVVDAPSTLAIGPLVKISAWFDNEWGYSTRVADVAALLAGASG